MSPKKFAKSNEAETLTIFTRHLTLLTQARSIAIASCAGEFTSYDLAFCTDDLDMIAKK